MLNSNNQHLYNERINNNLVVMGSRCQIYPIDNDTLKAEILTPWMDDNTLLIDKYDARCWLSDLSNFDDFKSEYLAEDSKIENLCEYERYCDLKESSPDLDDNNDVKELDNQNRSGIYSSVEYSYDDSNEVKPDDLTEEVSDEEKDDDISYQLPPELKVPDNMELPKTEKQAAKIEKTATFIASHGIQMEILLKTKQGNNKKFHFLNFDDKLNSFYKFLLDRIKNAEYIPAKRQLFHLTKTDDSTSTTQNISLSLPKVDISNTAYYKLIKKYRSADKNNGTDSQPNEKPVDSNYSQNITAKLC